jgi:hypothetical protein
MRNEILAPKGRAPHTGKIVHRRFTDIWRNEHGLWRLALRQATVTRVGEVVSAAQVDLYAASNGDIDLYQRRGSPQMHILGDSWKTIEDLRRRLFLAATGRASATFAASVEADLLAWTSDEEARCRIRAIVDVDVRAQSKS